MDDTPVSSTVSPGIRQEEAASARDASAQGGEGGSQPDTRAGRPSSPRLASTPATLFEPTSEEEELAVDSGWDAVRPLPAAEGGSEARANRAGTGSPL